MKQKIIDFKCDCGCGSKTCGTLRFFLTRTNNIKSLDIGIMYGRQKQPKIGVYIEDDNLDKLIKFLTK